MEDDGTGAAVEIKRPKDETTIPVDEDTSEKDTSEDGEKSEEEDNSDSKEPSGTTLQSKSTHWSGGASIDTSDYNYRLGISSGPR